MLTVTIDTAGPGCQACAMTKRHLDRRGIAYNEVPLDSDEGILAACRELGFTTAPVVCVSSQGVEHAWEGYRPDRIDALAGASADAGQC